MTADKKKVEVGCARAYHFVDIDGIENTASSIHLFNSRNKAKASFSQSWAAVEWNEELDAFTDWLDKTKVKYVIVPVTITYEVGL